jgi:hypothetical protein
MECHSLSRKSSTPPSTLTAIPEDPYELAELAKKCGLSFETAIPAENLHELAEYAKDCGLSLETAGEELQEFTENIAKHGLRAEPIILEDENGKAVLLTGGIG